MPLSIEHNIRLNKLSIEQRVQALYVIYNYYIRNEEYEICAVIRDVINKYEPTDVDSWTAINLTINRFWHTDFTDMELF